MVNQLIDTVLGTIRTPVYWIWCRWRDHRGFGLRWHYFTKGDQSIEFRECWGCGRVYEEDADSMFAILDGDAESNDGPGRVRR